MVSELKLLLKKYKFLLDKAKRAKYIVTDDSLIIAKKGKYVEYYRQDSLTGKREYITKENLRVAKNLAFGKYIKKVTLILEKMIENLESFLSTFNPNELLDYYNSIPVERRVLINPIEPTVQMRLEKWRKQKIVKNSYPMPSNDIVTFKKEVVRSKSEQYIGNRLYLREKEYVYEMGILIDGEYVFPDFVIYDPVKDKIYVWEHFGMMEDPEYATLAIKKIEQYEKAGITRKDNLIVTFESKSKPLNSEWVDKLIDLYLE